MAQFKKGQSGNLAGRPKGIPDRRSQYRKALQNHADDIVQTVINQALAGDSVAMRICIDRIVPSLKATDSPVNIELSGDLSEQGRQVLEALGTGALSPGEAATVMSTLQTQARLIESDEIIERIEKLEKANDAQT